jgi:predicted DNA-binding transcriptional regulator YafY
MKQLAKSRRRPAAHITLARAARLHRLVMYLAESPHTREQILHELGIGLRTFYRELELLKRCGIKVRQTDRTYALQSTAAQAEGLLPFPDPQLSFAEMSELARYQGATAQRLALMLASVVSHHSSRKPRKRRQAQLEKTL